ncbi:CARDB domain-containing protein [Rubellicoccus peritrichatus]|uniref:CARDB domain-containing protein n=1 Tax=Rubellicoccus peritrichatus TaxID=3080537 RepID=A0AAQ3LCS0_9BACT|nr:CARDB domain-containing protein [Puniceicoccus sp. CR14]WOO42069.1 CARDB domain-containing protein [Puniceicoccus sp. CR14]
MKKLLRYIAPILVFSPVLLQAGDLKLSGLTSNDLTPDPGDLITLTWTAEAVDDKFVDSSTQGIYIGDNDSIGRNRGGDLIGTEPLGKLGGFFFETTKEVATVKLPDDLEPGRTYYIRAWADYLEEVDEDDDGNNGSNAIQITVRGPDLTAEDLEVTNIERSQPLAPITVSPGDELELSWTAYNRGSRSSSLLNFSQQAVIWSNDTIYSEDDVILDREPLGILTAGGDSPEKTTVNVPDDVVAGQTYFLMVFADADEEFSEERETNNLSNFIEVRIPSDGTDEEIIVTGRRYLVDGYTDYGDGWYDSWMGTVNVNAWPWVFQVDIGWFYAGADGNSNESSWFYALHPRLLTWFWIAEETDGWFYGQPSGQFLNWWYFAGEASDADDEFFFIFSLDGQTTIIGSDAS